MSDKMIITGVEAFGYHGFLDYERETGQPFVVDAKLSVDLRESGLKDEITETVDYNDLAILIHNEILGPSVKLIESLAERIAGKILKAYPTVKEVEVSVHKPRAPITVPFGSITVTIKRSR